MEKSPEFKMNSTKLEGSFGTEPIKMEILPVEGNPNIVINIHGTYGSLHGGNDKYLKFARNLQVNEVANTVLYESSRNNTQLGNSEDYFEQKKIRFEGKTFDDELEDLRKIIKHCIRNSEKEFGVPSSKLEITLNGNSLGGILAIYLADEFPQVINISTVATGDNLNIDNDSLPILKYFPSPDKIAAKAEKFKGKVLIQQGSADEVFQPDSIKRLQNYFKNAKTGLVTFKDVDHTFGKVNDKESPKPYEEIFMNIATLIEDGFIKRGEVSMESEKLSPEYKAIQKQIDKEIKEIGLGDHFTEDSPFNEDAPFNN